MSIVLKDVQRSELDKVAILITSLEEIDLINEYPNATYIALDKSIQQLNTNIFLIHYLAFKSKRINYN